MNNNTHTIKRLITGLVLAASLGALTVPSAPAGGNSGYGAPDGWYPHAVSLTKASTISRYGLPDPWALPYLASHTKAAPAMVDGRSPDTRRAAPFPPPAHKGSPGHDRRPLARHPRRRPGSPAAGARPRRRTLP